MSDNCYWACVVLFCVFVSCSFGYVAGNYYGEKSVASGKVVCQQALGEWVCKPKDEVK